MMDYRNWYCVQVASGCENKAMADLRARKTVVGDRFIKDIAVPETTELTFDKAGKRKAVKAKILPGYILVQVEKETVEEEDGSVSKVFPAFTQKTIRDTFNVIGFAGSNKNKPRQMRPSEVESVFARAGSVEDTEALKEEAKVDYNVGDVLKAISGPFEGQDIVVTSVQGFKIFGQTDMFGRSIPVEITANQVQSKETING